MEPMPPESWGGRAPENGSPLPTELETMDMVEAIEPQFVDYPLLQAATFHLLAGQPNVGKGALCARWIARCTNGEMYGEPRRALWLSSEEDKHRDLRPRLEVAGADLRLVSLIPDTFLLPRDIDWLHEIIDRTKDVGLAVIDPLSNHIRQMRIEEEVREAIQPLAQLCSETDVPGLGIRHLSTKEGKGSFISRILGATGFVGVARAVIGVARDYDGVLHVRTVKGNRVPASEAGQRFRLVSANYDGWNATIVKAEADGASSMELDDLITMVNRQALGSATEQGRRASLEIMEANGALPMTCDEHDAEVARLIGGTARMGRTVRQEYVDRGWYSNYPEKDEDGAVIRWMVKPTNAIRWPSARDEARPPSTLSSLETTPDARARDTRPALDEDPQISLQISTAVGDASDGLTDASDGLTVEASQDQIVTGESNQTVTGQTEIERPVCPTCGSTDVGVISGRCHRCGEKVRDSLV